MCSWGKGVVNQPHSFPGSFEHGAEKTGALINKGCQLNIVLYHPVSLASLFQLLYFGETKSGLSSIGSLQKCGNISTPAGLMWLSPLVFCFGYMPGLLLICYLLPSISDTKQPAHAGLKSQNMSLIC